MKYVAKLNEDHDNITQEWINLKNTVRDTLCA